MATTCSILNAYVGSYGNVVLKLGAKVKDIHYDVISKTTSEVEVDEIAISLRAFVAQLIAARPEVSDFYSQVKLARDDKKPALMSSFIRLMTRDASYDIDAVLHSAGQKFEDGTIARYDGYTYSIVSAKFADAVEAVLQPKSLDDDLKAFGY